jgi:asparagine synthase (glutamine-hydrolysing)
MQAQSERPIKTFTIGFEDEAYNEATHAKAVAKHIGTEHTELYITPKDALSVIPKLSSIYCEPFSDSSQIPTFLVSQLASEHVTVALSGDGGDELFGGYNRYLMAQQVWNKNRKLPRPIRRLASTTLTAFAPKSWDAMFTTLNPILPKKLRLSAPGDKAHKLAGVLNIDSEQDFYQSLTSHWQQPETLVIGAKEPSTLISDINCWPKTDSFQHAMMAMDAQTYMTDDILVKVDRAAMANSLETRVPMLDHRIVELAWKMPLEYKIRHGEGKWLLKQVLFRHVPCQLIERPKMGFSLPLHDWLRGSLRDWAEALLDEKLLLQQGYFYPAPIRMMWTEHLSGKYNHQDQLWNILMFQAWLETQ